MNSSILMSFSASAIFLFHFFHMGKTFPFEDFFHLGKQTKVTRGKMGWTGRVGNGCPLFVVKHCWTLSTMWAGVLINHPSWNWQTHWKSLKKNFTEAEHSLSQQHQLAQCYRWVPRTLNKQGKPVLQRACLPEDNSVFGGIPPRIHIHTHNTLKFYRSTIYPLSWSKTHQDNCQYNTINRNARQERSNYW